MSAQERQAFDRKLAPQRRGVRAVRANTNANLAEAIRLMGGLGGQAR